MEGERGKQVHKETGRREVKMKEERKQNMRRDRGDEMVRRNLDLQSMYEMYLSTFL